MIVMPPFPGQIWVAKRGIPQFIDIISVRQWGDYDQFQIEICPISSIEDHAPRFIDSQDLFAHYHFVMSLHEHINEWMAKINWRPGSPSNPTKGDIFRNNDNPDRLTRIMQERLNRCWHQPLIPKIWTYSFTDCDSALIKTHWSFVCNIHVMLQNIWDQIQSKRTT